MASSDDAFALQMCPLYVEDGEEESLAAKIDVQQLRAKQEILVGACTIALQCRQRMPMLHEILQALFLADRRSII